MYVIEMDFFSQKYPILIINNRISRQMIEYCPGRVSVRDELGDVTSLFAALFVC
jgi:hypothetical protein